MVERRSTHTVRKTAVYPWYTREPLGLLVLRRLLCASPARTMVLPAKATPFARPCNASCHARHLHRLACAVRSCSSPSPKAHEGVLTVSRLLFCRRLRVRYARSEVEDMLEDVVIGRGWSQSLWMMSFIGAWPLQSSYMHRCRCCVRIRGCCATLVVVVAIAAATGVWSAGGRYRPLCLPNAFIMLFSTLVAMMKSSQPLRSAIATVVGGRGHRRRWWWFTLCRESAQLEQAFVRYASPMLSLCCSAC